MTTLAIDSLVVVDPAVPVNARFPSEDADLTAAEAWAVNPIPRGVAIYLGLKLALILAVILIAWIWLPHGVATWR